MVIEPGCVCKSVSVCLLPLNLFASVARRIVRKLKGEDVGRLCWGDLPLASETELPTGLFSGENCRQEFHGFALLSAALVTSAGSAPILQYCLHV